jgi:hypothetical protein
MNNKHILKRILVFNENELEGEDMRTFCYLESGDYTVNLIMDNDNYCFLDDNIHSHPDSFIEGYEKALVNLFGFVGYEYIQGVLVVPNGVYTYSFEEIKPYLDKVMWED